jgi:hypothetical protein
MRPLYPAFVARIERDANVRMAKLSAADTQKPFEETTETVLPRYNRRLRAMPRKKRDMEPVPRRHLLRIVRLERSTDERRASY